MKDMNRGRIERTPHKVHAYLGRYTGGMVAGCRKPSKDTSNRELWWITRRGRPTEATTRAGMETMRHSCEGSENIR